MWTAGSLIQPVEKMSNLKNHDKKNRCLLKYFFLYRRQLRVKPEASCLQYFFKLLFCDFFLKTFVFLLSITVLVFMKILWILYFLYYFYFKFFKNSELDTHGCFVAGERDCVRKAWALYREWRCGGNSGQGQTWDRKNTEHAA